jgi:putative tricarboxylic transport membrane protein
MFVPLLALGLPVTATAAVLLAAMRTYGIVPGPTLMTDQPELVWTLLASLLIGNTLLLVINLPLAPLWARLLRIPRPQLYAGILFFASLGAYAVNQSAFDVALLLVFGGIGFAVRRFGIPILPLILGVIIGPLMETKMREALDLSDGDVSGLFNEPLAILVYVLIVLVLVLPPLLTRLRGRPLVPEDVDERTHTHGCHG